MADEPRSPRTKAPATPRWVKLSVIIAIAVVVVVVVAALLTGGEHGPSRHLPEGLHPADIAPAAHSTT
jgi:hypothetical protein